MSWLKTAWREISKRDDEKADISGQVEAVSKFGRRASRLVEGHKRSNLKKLYSQCSAEARLSNNDDQMETRETMRRLLREKLIEPSSRVKRGWFDDM